MLGNAFVMKNGMILKSRALSAGMASNQSVAGAGAEDGAAADGQTFTASRNAVQTGGGSNETFVFKAHPGQGTVTDFAATGAGHDVLSFASSSFASVADVLRHTHQVGADTVISLDKHDSVTLQNVNAAALKAHPHDFALHA